MKAILLDLYDKEAHRPVGDVPEVRTPKGDMQVKAVISWGDRVFVKTTKMREGRILYREVHAWICPDTAEGYRIRHAF